jgi:hypothetical protein
MTITANPSVNFYSMVPPLVPRLLGLLLQLGQVLHLLVQRPQEGFPKYTSLRLTATTITFTYS